MTDSTSGRKHFIGVKRILGNDRLDGRQLGHLMAERLRIVTQ